jgi:hypothetical protein
MEQFYTVFSSHMLEWGWFLHTLHFLHFEELAKEMDKDDENHDRFVAITPTTVIWLRPLRSVLSPTAWSAA